MEKIRAPQWLSASTGKNSTESDGSGRQPLWENCSRSLAARQATILLGCFKWDDAGNPEIITRAVIEMCCQYPEWAVKAVTDPLDGMPAHFSRMPALAEIKAALEDQVGFIRRNAEREEHTAGAFRRLPAPAKVDDASRERVSRLVAQFKADMSNKPSAEMERKAAQAFTEELAAQVARGESPLAKIPSNPVLSDKIAEWKREGKV